MNIFFLIGHAGSGKSLYGRAVKEYLDNSNQDIVYYDEDEQVAKIAGYDSFKTLVKNETNVQQYYNKYIKSLLVETANNKHKIFVISTGGQSPLMDDSLYCDGYKIYIKSSKKDILKSINERTRHGNSYFIIQGFETNPKQLEFKEFTNSRFQDYFHKANHIYESLANLIIHNKHDCPRTLQDNIETIVNFIEK